MRLAVDQSTPMFLQVLQQKQGQNTVLGIRQASLNQSATMPLNHSHGTKVNLDPSVDVLKRESLGFKSVGMEPYGSSLNIRQALNFQSFAHKHSSPWILCCQVLVAPVFSTQKSSLFRVWSIADPEKNQKQLSGHPKKNNNSGGEIAPCPSAGRPAWNCAMNLGDVKILLLT